MSRCLLKISSLRGGNKGREFLETENKKRKTENGNQTFEEEKLKEIRNDKDD